MRPASQSQGGQVWVGLLAVGLAAIVLAACGSSSSTKTAASASTTAAPTTTAPASSTTQAPTTTESQAAMIAALAKVGPAKATGLTVSLTKGPKGIFLIGPDGHTLYIFTKDQGTTTACTTAECMNFWPALRSTSTPTTGPGINAAMVTVAHGQVAYYGHLLYYFKGDTAPGQTNGTTIADWDLLGPFGNVMLPQA
jgi:predicted lipoprotein with Yx(FWY)xxD motif